MRERVLARIDLGALKHNFDRVKALCPNSQVLAMVKANAYAHGLTHIALNLPWADYFGVATLEEAEALREAGVLQPIVLMAGVYEAADLEDALRLHCHLVLHVPEQIELIRSLGRFPTGVWIKVDTGMHRYGFTEQAALACYRVVRDEFKIQHIQWLSHFACADQAEDPSVLGQIERFQAVLNAYQEPKSLSNSAAILQYPEAHLDIVRPGMMLYGVSPRAGGQSIEDGLQPVMTLSSKVTAVKDVITGGTVGYGAGWVAQRPSRVAVVCAGYGDGYPQLTPNGTPVLVNGHEAHTVGRVSMDSMVIDVTDIPQVSVGNEVILWGEGLPIERVAQAMGMSPYGLLLGLTPRVCYKYHQDPILK